MVMARKNVYDQNDELFWGIQLMKLLENIYDYEEILSTSSFSLITI